MPDITMCLGTDCPLKDKCYRFRAYASSRQSFFADIPYDNDTKSCEYFWLITQADVERLNKAWQ